MMKRGLKEAVCALGAIGLLIGTLMSALITILTWNMYITEKSIESAVHMPFIYILVTCVLLYVASVFTEKYTRRDVLEMLYGSFMAIGGILAGAFVLSAIVQAITDPQQLNAEKYQIIGSIGVSCILLLSALYFRKYAKDKSFIAHWIRDIF